MSHDSTLMECTHRDPLPEQASDLPHGDPEFEDVRADVVAYVAEVMSGRIRPRNGDTRRRRSPA